MKKDIKLRITTFLCGALLVMSGCKDESPFVPDMGEDEGAISFKELQLDVNTDLQVVKTRGDEDIDVSKYIVKLCYQSTGEQVGPNTKWEYGKMPEVMTLAVGKYRIEVESYDWTDLYAEWEKPHYLGTFDFEIKAGEITKADKVPCQLQNVKVTIVFSEALKKILDDAAYVDVSAGKQIDETGFAPTLQYYRDETRAGYFKSHEDSRTLVATLHYHYAGIDNAVTHTSTDVKAGQHHIIEYDYKNSTPDLPEKTGTASRGDIQLSVKVTIVDVYGTITIKESVLSNKERPGKEDDEDPEDPNQPDQPTVDDITIPNPNAEGNKPYFDLDKVNEVKAAKEGDPVKEYKLTINSKNGFESLKVEIKSHEKGLTPEVLNGVELASKFDLATGLAEDGRDLSEALSGLGFPVKEEVTGVNTVDFDITQFVPLLCIYPGDHSFVLTVVDKKGTTKTIVLKFKALAN